MEKFKELNKNELMEIYGGKVDYYEYSWTGTNNPIIYTAEAVVNGGKAIANAGIWIWNQFVD
ncbi:Blp family class II bacteriocin [Belliella aquatica]|uniref:Bacteriocin-type signal sequence n=1 Tax=Belliella aquatica TaxID=1323734 RepID=A0ABQ1M9Y2_9BACT|nr:bacteriocin [Belliella aquatica]MCH7405538.1 bacteriocin [Belliella aquatica]GGC35780.1 hypothetical protein GCM10010993_13300 [Belliella aquatica]